MREMARAVTVILSVSSVTVSATNSLGIRSDRRKRDRMALILLRKPHQLNPEHHQK